MWAVLVILIVTVIARVAANEEFVVYTHVSIRDDNGKPCLTGCSPNTHECITEARGTYREKRSCKILDEPAPIYLTAQKEDPGSKHCLSNCGRFNKFFDHEWCFTKKDLLTWDYCSSNTHRSLLPNGHLQSTTSQKGTCTDQCGKSKEKTYFWCFSGKTWNYCALAALPRIPVLDNNYLVGPTNKGNCDDFLRYDSIFHESYTSSSDVPDNSIIGIAEAIEAVGSNTLTQVFTLYEFANPVQSYSMVKIGNIMVPAVIRAHFTKDIYNLFCNSSDSKIPLSVERKLRQQMSYARGSYEGGTIISSNLGGPNADYNLVPRTPNWKCGNWGDMEEAITNWCNKTGGSVDLLIVIFYEDAKTPIPKAFGVSQVYKNADRSVFVDCREKIYWNK